MLESKIVEQLERSSYRIVSDDMGTSDYATRRIRIVPRVPVTTPDLHTKVTNEIRELLEGKGKLVYDDNQENKSSLRIARTHTMVYREGEETIIIRIWPCSEYYEYDMMSSHRVGDTPEEIRGCREKCMLGFCPYSNYPNRKTTEMVSDTLNDLYLRLYYFGWRKLKRKLRKR